MPSDLLRMDKAQEVRTEAQGLLTSKCQEEEKDIAKEAKTEQMGRKEGKHDETEAKEENASSIKSSVMSRQLRNEERGRLNLPLDTATWRSR